MLSWPSGVRGLGIPSLELHCGVAMTIGAPLSGRFHLTGCPVQSLYILPQGIGSLICCLMHLPSFSEGTVMWVFAPYPGPVRGFGPAAGPQNACSVPLQILFWPGNTPPLPHPFFQGSTYFLIKGLHLLWPIWWETW